jgi:hypothetical protein
MEKVKSLYKLSGLALLAALAACGDDPYYNNPNYNIYNAVAGGCQIPLGTKTQTVKANLGNGATIVLDLYEVSGGISAVGEVNIPSLDSLYGYGYGGASNGVSGQGIRTCVSSNGSVGSIDGSASYRDIELSLRGNGVYIEMGSRTGVQAYVSGNNILGSLYMEFPLDPARYPAMTFAVTY